MEANERAKIIKGMTWTGLEKLFTQVIRFAFGIVLARLLAPGDYGLMGMLCIFFGLSAMFVDSGFGAALIQKKECTEADYATVFFFNLAMALACYGILFLASPWIAAFYKMPVLCSVCRVAALSIPLGALSAIQRTRLTIALNFHVQTAVTLVSLLISGGVGIAMALKGMGVWALVAQMLADGVFTALLFWTISKWHPVLCFSRTSFRRFFSYGWKHLCTSVINCIYGNIYSLVIGKAFGAAEIGYYTRADGFAALPGSTVTEAMMRVNFPVLANLQDDRDRLIAAYRRLIRTPLFILTPLLLGMAVTAEPIVAVTIGEKWLPCVPFLRVICVGMLFEPLTVVNLNLLYVKGRTDCVLKLECVKKPIAFALLAAMVPFGILWMCVGRVLYAFLAFVFNCHYTKKFLDYGFAAQLKDLFPIFLNGCVMSLVVAMVIHPLAGPWLKLLVGVPAGAICYLVFAALMKDESLQSIVSVLRPRIGG